MTVAPATQEEADVGGSLVPGRLRLEGAVIELLHYSLGNKATLHLKIIWPGMVGYRITCL